MTGQASARRAQTKPLKRWNSLFKDIISKVLSEKRGTLTKSCSRGKASLWSVLNLAWAGLDFERIVLAVDQLESPEKGIYCLHPLN
jgi:hypothetical protein